jgi:hypothetical protein
MEGVRRRSLSGASALLTRKFTRSKSNRAKRRATISVTPHDHKIHLRIVPNIENINRSLIFEIVDREMEIGEVIKMGRYSDRRANETNCMSFKSKVVSRYHCEVWAESNGKVKLYLSPFFSFSLQKIILQY